MDRLAEILAYIKVIPNELKTIVEYIFNYTSSSHYHSSALESKALVLSGAGLLKSAVIENEEATDLYFQVFDASSEPAGGSAPLITLRLPANTVGSFEYNQSVSTGIYVALSSTQFTYTDAAAEANLNVEYKDLS